MCSSRWEIPPLSSGSSAEPTRYQIWVITTGARWSSFTTIFSPFSNWYSWRPDISMANADGVSWLWPKGFWVTGCWTVDGAPVSIALVWQAASDVAKANAQATRSDGVDSGKNEDMIGSTYIKWQLINWWVHIPALTIAIEGVIKIYAPQPSHWQLA